MRLLRTISCVLALSLLWLVAAPGVVVAQGGTSYVVRPGDSLQSIANAHGTSVGAIMSANGLTDADLIWYGQVLKIPVAGTETLASTSGGTTYTVKPGDTLVNIAAAYGTTAGDLMRANGLANADLLRTGQVLLIPGRVAEEPPATAVPAPSPIPEPAASTAEHTPNTYTVKQGDTLASIAQAHGLTTVRLAQANDITNANVLYPGQVLLIPGASASDPMQAPVSGTPGETRYTVKAGDTLGQIALRYGVTAAAIARANGLSSPDLVSVGMDLVIPIRYTQPLLWPGKATRFVASISEQRCWLYQANNIIADWTCSTGRGSAPSVPGTYKIQTKMDKAYGSTWNIWMPYWLGIYYAGASENGIHGIPWDATTGTRVWEGLVGTPITFGCIMLTDDQAKMLYDMAYIGMPVIILP